eukprot:768656-Hanusia_phi.AAC.3
MSRGPQARQEEEMRTVMLMAAGLVEMSQERLTGSLMLWNTTRETTYCSCSVLRLTWQQDKQFALEAANAHVAWADDREQIRQTPSACDRQPSPSQQDAQDRSELHAGKSGSYMQGLSMANKQLKLEEEVLM